jgi:hypothetical protein
MQREDPIRRLSQWMPIQPRRTTSEPGQAATVGRGPDLRLVLLGGLAALVVGAVILQLGVLIVHAGQCE